ncbi:hypothetical protein DMENIID0001_122100 [Sergentomyia squamirostris]
MVHVQVGIGGEEEINAWVILGGITFKAMKTINVRQFAREKRTQCSLHTTKELVYRNEYKEEDNWFMSIERHPHEQGDGERDH